MRMILIGTATSIALVAGTVSAQPGGNEKDHGGGKDHGNGAPHGNAKADAQDHSPARQVQRPAMQPPVGVQEHKPWKVETARHEGAPEKGSQKSSDKGPAKHANGNAASKPGTGHDKTFAKSPPPQRKDVKRVSYKGPGGRTFFVPTNDRVRVVTKRRTFDWGSLSRPAAYDGCPPGLAKKYNGCMPPGLAGQTGSDWLRPDWYFRDYDHAYRYRYLDGYMLRLGAGGDVLSYMPLLGGALGIGQVWPSVSQAVPMPTYYDSYYDLGPADSYRYYDDTIYRVDPDSAVIRSVAALLTGNDFVIGKAAPAGYDVYNVPYDYRDQYYDSPDALYRYSDGYIYQIDPTTRLVQAAIELLA
jgi:hypothetical protein